MMTIDQLLLFGQTYWYWVAFGSSIIVGLIAWVVSRGLATRYVRSAQRLLDEEKRAFERDRQSEIDRMAEEKRGLETEHRETFARVESERDDALQRMETKHKEDMQNRQALHAAELARLQKLYQEQNVGLERKLGTVEASLNQRGLESFARALAVLSRDALADSQFAAIQLAFDDLVQQPAIQSLTYYDSQGTVRIATDRKLLNSVVTGEDDITAMNAMKIRSTEREVHVPVMTFTDRIGTVKVVGMPPHTEIVYRNGSGGASTTAGPDARQVDGHAVPAMVAVE